MKIRELHKLLSERLKREENHPRYEEEEVGILLQTPSIGPRSCAGVESVQFGFDWDRGRVLLTPSEPLVVKSEKQAVWDLAYDHIYKMTKRVSCSGSPTSEARWAMRVLEMAKERTK